MKHWVVKAMVFKILRELGRAVGSEVEVNGGIVDVLDIDSMIVYEVERKLRNDVHCDKRFRGIRDVFIINLKDVPNTVNEAEKYLREKVV